jgi:hypothetical protein
MHRQSLLFRPGTDLTGLDIDTAAVGQVLLQVYGAAFFILFLRRSSHAFISIVIIFDLFVLHDMAIMTQNKQHQQKDEKRENCKLVIC